MILKYFFGFVGISIISIFLALAVIASAKEKCSFLRISVYLFASGIFMSWQIYIQERAWQDAVCNALIYSIFAAILLFTFEKFSVPFLEIWFNNLIQYPLTSRELSARELFEMFPKPTYSILRINTLLCSIFRVKGAFCRYSPSYYFSQIIMQSKIQGRLLNIPDLQCQTNHKQ